MTGASVSVTWMTCSCDTEFPQASSAYHVRVMV